MPDLDALKATIEILKRGGLSAFLIRVLNPWWLDMSRDEHIAYLEAQLAEYEAFEKKMNSLCERMPRSGFWKTIRDGKI